MWGCINTQDRVASLPQGSPSAAETAVIYNMLPHLIFYSSNLNTIFKQLIYLENKSINSRMVVTD
jgi:hypothetical protein